MAAKKETSKPSSGETVGRAVKIAAESVVTPGASLILDGKYRQGIFHVLGAGVARALLGPVGVGLVALNSYSKSVSGRHLLSHVTSRGGDSSGS